MERNITFERTVAVDYDAAAAALRERPGLVVLDHADPATLVLHSEVAGFDVARTVSVALEDVRQLDRHAVALPLRWQATERPRRFPTFTGMLELSMLSERPAQSQLALVGTIRTPLGMLGSVGEAAGGSQLADAVLEALVERFADRLSGLVADRVAVAAATATPARMSRPRIVLED